MATELRGFDLPFLASADLSALQHTIVKYNTTARQVAPATAKTDKLCGVLMNKPDAAGKAATVRTAGFCKVVAGEAIAVGDTVTAGAGGKAFKLTASDTNDIYFIGVALTACSNASEMIVVHLNIQRDVVGGAIS